MEPTPEAHGTRERMVFVLATALLVLAVLLGGGQGTLGDSGVQLLALVLLAVVIATQGARPPPAWTWLPVALVVAVPLLQLLPLPEAAWLASGSRAELADQMRAAGVEPAPRWGLNPLGSERALAWLLPAIAL